MANCLLGLGSNLGNRQQQLNQATQQLAEHVAIDLLAVSRFHSTPPAGGPSGQDPFLNAAVLLQTSLSPLELLSATQTIEGLLGREREVHWGPRSIDVDLLIYDDVVCCTEHLTLPHPWMVARRFVVDPAAEIAPTMVHPVLGWTLKRLEQHLREAPDRLAVEGIAGRNLGERIQQQVSASFIADPNPQPLDDGSSILDGSQQIELI